MAKAKQRSISGPKEVFYATLGVQKAAYEMGVEKYSQLNEKVSQFDEKRKINIESFIQRGEEVESIFVEKFEEFKARKNIVSKGVVGVEEQYQKLADLVADLTDKVKSIAPVKAPQAKSRKTPVKKAVKKTTKAVKKAPRKVAAKKAA